MSAPRPYRLDQAKIADTFRARLPEHVSDLLDIAIAVHSIDRLTTTRDLRDSIAGGWCRELSAVIEVRDVDFWSTAGVGGAVTGLLEWLTDDRWELSFVPFRRQRPPEETQETLFSLRPESTAAVGCFSGGLDSFGGAAIDLGEPGDLELVLVGQSGTSRARALQRQLAGALTFRTARVQPLLVKANLIGAKGRLQDRQQRSRGLLFLSLAAATALVAKVGEVRVYENGIGAINLPYSHSQIGAHMSRSAHPKTLVGMQRLVDMMGLGDLRFSLPRVFDTKAQVVARIPEKFADLISTTVSCDTWSSDRQPSPPDGKRAHLCGSCASCVLRRQALRASGMHSLDAGDRYRSDVFDLKCTTESLFALRLMLGQVAELDAATSGPDPWAGLIEAYPQLVDARDALRELRSAADVEDRLVGLYRSYVDEWHQVNAPTVDRYLGGVGV